MSDDSTLLPRAAARALRADAVPVATLVYHPDVSRVGERAPLDRGFALGRNGPDFAPPEGGAARPIEDRYVSAKKPVQITPVLDGFAIEAPGTVSCAVDGRPIPRAGRVTIDRTALDRGVVIELAERVVILLHLARPPVARQRHGLIGDSDAIDRVRVDIDRVADLDVPVLLRGETGTGKELVARAIHASGPRARAACVAVNVAALPPTTAASELFGHAKGAFTGAVHDHDGLFVRADGGTLFLDEIGEIPFDVQPMLLRALESGEVTPIGGARTRKVVVRVLAATDADLETQVAESGFREALYHRLAGYQLFVPPLRERRDDIGRLLVHFMREEVTRTGDLDRLAGQVHAPELWLPASLVARFVRHAWPGNVRQLRNAARQLAIGNRGAAEVAIDTALERLLAVELPPPPVALSSPSNVTALPPRDFASITDDDLLAALRANHWRVPAAAASMGISRSKFYQLIEKSDRIKKAKDIPEAELRRALAECGNDIIAAAAQLEVSDKALKDRVGDLGTAG